MNKTKINKKILYVILACICAFALGAAVVGAVWGGLNASQNNSAQPDINSQCEIYLKQKQSQVSSDRGASDELIGQFSTYPKILNNLPNPISSRDLAFIQNCEAQLSYVASDASQASFDKLITAAQYPTFDSWFDTIAQLNHNLHWNFDSLFTGSWLAQNSIEQDYKQGMLPVMVALSNLIGLQNTSKLVWSIEAANPVGGGTVAVTIASFASYFQCMVYGPTFDDLSLIINQYQMGFWSSHQLVSVMVHEFGHALSNLLYLAPQSRSLLNSDTSQYPTNCASLVSPTIEHLTGQQFDIMHIRSNLSAYVFKQNPNEFLITDLADRIGLSPENLQWQKLFAFSTVQSGYGRVGGDPELFAEAFAQWLLTPAANRGLSWELLNLFFTEDLPAHYLALM